MRWKKDLSLVFEQMATVVRPGGTVIVMVGDSLAANRVVDAGDTIREVAGRSFRIAAWAAQERPKWRTQEKEEFGQREKREHIILCTRTSEG